MTIIVRILEWQLAHFGLSRKGRFCAGGFVGALILD
jgi:hypothetical protein